MADKKNDINIGKEIGKAAAGIAAACAASYVGKQYEKELVEKYTVIPAPIYHLRTDGWQFIDTVDILIHTTNWGRETVNVHMIIDNFDFLDAKVSISNCVQGPNYTRMLATPKGKTKKEDIFRIESDLQFFLENPGLLITEVDGKLYLDMPRRTREIIYFADIARTDEFKIAGKTSVCLGMDINNAPETMKIFAEYQ